MTTEQKIIKNKLGLLGLARTLGNVSQACKVMGFPRDSFYRFNVTVGVTDNRAVIAVAANGVSLTKLSESLLDWNS